MNPVEVGARSRVDAADTALAYLDQASFAWVWASGHVHAIQLAWVYERELDMGGLQRLHDNLTHGLLARRVERSALPFGRHRWVSWQPSSGIHVAAAASSPEAIADWIDRRAAVPVHPEHGPSWHLAVLPVPGYGAAVSLVASHTVIDGVGLARAVADAAQGVRHSLGYPPPGSRTRRRALGRDARRGVRDLPDMGRALVAAAKLAPQTARPAPRPPAPRAPEAPDRPVQVPTATLYIDLDEWDARARVLGGNSNALFAGYAARLAHRVGRVRPGDGRVSLAYPVNDRVEGDTRANALKSVDFTVDPTPVTRDLRGIRADIKQALTQGMGRYNEQAQVLPLTPLVPKVLVKALAVQAANGAELPVGCSNIGEIDAATVRIDGMPADYFTISLIEQNLTESSPELAYGQLYMVSGRACGKLFMTFRYWEPGGDNSRQRLRDLVAQTLADFELTGVIR